MPKLPTAGELQNFYPRPPRGGRPEAYAHNAVEQTISIHALREEGDWHLQDPEVC